MLHAAMPQVLVLILVLGKVYSAFQFLSGLIKSMSTKFTWELNMNGPASISPLVQGTPGPMVMKVDIRALLAKVSAEEFVFVIEIILTP